MAVQKAGTIRKADSSLTIRQSESDRSITSDRSVVGVIIEGVSTALLPLTEGTPISLTISNTSSDAVAQNITLAIKDVSPGGTSIFNILSKVPIPQGVTLVLGREELAFDSINFRLSATLGVSSGTAKAHLIFRL